MDKWQRITDTEVCKGILIFPIVLHAAPDCELRVPTESLDLLSEYCSEFLIHAADVEGLCKGIDEDLVKS